VISTPIGVALAPVGVLLALLCNGVSPGWANGQAEMLEIARLTLRQDTDAKALAAWKQLAEERRGATEKLYKVRELLSVNGCDCECGCDCDGHEDDCERCLACRIAEAVGK